MLRALRKFSDLDEKVREFLRGLVLSDTIQDIRRRGRTKVEGKRRYVIVPGN